MKYLLALFAMGVVVGLTDCSRSLDTNDSTEVVNDTSTTVMEE